MKQKRHFRKSDMSGTSCAKREKQVYFSIDVIWQLLELLALSQLFRAENHLSFKPNPFRCSPDVLSVVIR
jgi:hypothetical protein